MTTCDTEPAISLDDALKRLQSRLQPIIAYQQLPLRDALGRVLATAIHAPHNVPPAANSAMDGYALAHQNWKFETVTLQQIGAAYAGHPFSKTVTAGQCVRIFTGGVLPEGTDTVVMQEDVNVQGDTISFPSQIAQQHGQYVNAVAQDLQQGQAILPQGKRLGAADLGLLASLGIAEVAVTRRLRVTFFSTGDELCSIGTQPTAGQIFDSNRYTLHAMLQTAGVAVRDLGVVRDQPEAVEQALHDAASDSDVILSSGGVSVGDADYVTKTLQRIGTLEFWKIAVKPGRPLAFGKIGDSWFFGLPGNPVAVMGTFYHFVLPALRYLCGETPKPPLRFQVPCSTELRKQPGRQEFQRGILEHDVDGQLIVRSTGKQSSAILSSMSHANCFIVLAADCTGVAVGEMVWVEPFEGLM